MRICFICIGYELGRDGVGDYVRGLIAHLPPEHASAVIAINDPVIEDATSAGSSETGNPLVVRISSRLPRHERYRRANAAIRAFNPDVVSLQFVTWAFGPRGIVLGEATALRALANDRCLHVMFHEPWLRPLRRNGLRSFVIHGLLGQLQRASIIRLAAVLGAAVAHTSNRDYQGLFARAGIATGILPIFGGVVPVAGDGWETVRALARAADHDDPGARSRYLIAGIFGAIRERWDALPLLRRLMRLAARDGRQLMLISIGHNTPLGQALVNHWARKLPEMATLTLGSQPAAAISQVISSLDIGLAHQPTTALARSTTTAAMLEHGKPVIAAMGGALIAHDPFAQQWRSLLIELGPGLENEIGCVRVAQAPITDLRGDTATRLAQELEQACRPRPARPDR